MAENKVDLWAYVQKRDILMVSLKNIYNYGMKLFSGGETVKTAEKYLHEISLLDLQKDKGKISLEEAYRGLCKIEEEIKEDEVLGWFYRDEERIKAFL
ncbi:hypothetical protein ACO3UB_08360 (plasmid) [Methanocaldococcus sp. 16A]